MNGLSFIAIDLETATRERFSICEIGIAIVEDSKIIASKSWLVQPPYNRYDYFNIMVHGINPNDTKDCPTFPEVWNDVVPLLNNRIIVAHNASFDMYALKDAFKVWHIDYPSIEYYCSYRVAQKVVPNCDSYSLPCICRELNIDFGKHHRAEGDAIGCAKVFIECINRVSVSSLEELQNLFKFECGSFRDSTFSPFHSTKYNKKS